MARYKDDLRDLVTPLRVARILEVGCGEGYIDEFLSGTTAASIEAVDVDREVLCEARRRCPQVGFAVADGHHLPYRAGSFDLVVACEVLEHVSRPEEFLGEIARVTRRYSVLSVPREPIWRFLNVLRGAYLTELGNTPGHIQHWSGRAFLRVVGRHFRVVEVRFPLPWVMVLCERRDGVGSGELAVADGG
ncbi:MAG: class I SAM-dependent methyltransferase [Gemmatimonadetes bacterium]|nr:class I SAM-dependent methyltransferase [Gemmatimonadota bacterium]